MFSAQMRRGASPRHLTGAKDCPYTRLSGVIMIRRTRFLFALSPGFFPGAQAGRAAVMEKLA
ncbi:hypothetical protein EEB11_06785 [Pseudotabrizicola sediminis]|uniref:Uncharacterized protein n=1 Tax=Pseudotabrizicola sediminis TaxID=2486418 RepID=A0ABY2KSR9_9RHOB|nr:hypothetical protein EEB11_06785 [Pseudotabrizicola sediminis]